MTHQPDYTLDAILTARLLDNFLPLLSPDVRDLINEEMPEELTGLHGYEAALTRMLDHVVDLEDARGASSLEIFRQERAEAADWLRQVRRVLANIPALCAPHALQPEAA